MPLFIKTEFLLFIKTRYEKTDTILLVHPFLPLLLSEKERRELFFTSTRTATTYPGHDATLDGLPFHIAKTQGIYDSLGLDLTILSFNSANDRDAAFQTRKMDGMITDYPSAVALQAIHHTDLGFILKNDGYFCFIVSKESNINQLEQLKEKNIAVSRNTVIEYATDQLLSKAGIKHTEINMPEIGQLPLRLQMLQYNQLMPLSYPTLPHPSP